jgi:hypothetical protein
MNEHPYYFPEPDCMWALHAPVSDYIVRFENLEADLNEWLAVYGLGPVTLPVENVSETRADRPYQTYYDEPTRRYVEERFAVEMAGLGYRWEA